MRLQKKITFFLCLYLSLFAIFFFFRFSLRRNTNLEFEKISTKILQQSYEKDSLSLHFALKDPSQFGFRNSAAQKLPCYDRNEYLVQKEKTEKLLSVLKAFPTDNLFAEAKETYDILLYTTQNQRKGSDFLYFEEPLSPTSGMHLSLPILLSEYAMDEEKDVQNYLSLLTQIPSYFDSLGQYETDKASLGMFMAAFDADMVISQCQFMASEEGRTLFDSCFTGQLRGLYKPQSKAYLSYQKKQENIFRSQIAPAYKKLADTLLHLKDSTKEQRGLCQYRQGKKYYEYRLRTLIGTDKSCEEISNLLQKKMRQLCSELSTLRSGYNDTGTLREEDAASEKSNPASLSIDRYLPSLQEDMKQDFPFLPSTSSVTIKKILPSLKPYTAPAYYFIPRISLCKKGSIKDMENVIYYNEDSCHDPISLYTTLAHEGFPGHMYQNIYFIAHHGVNSQNILRYSMDFPGYSEGWAMYVELLSYEKASSISGKDKTYCQMLRLSREIQLCMLCYLDVKIHANGATLTDITHSLAQISIKDPHSMDEVYCYLINEPGTYLKYYVGYLELLECKELFRKEMEKEGKAYSDLAFHTFFLQHGPDSYPRIRKEIASYIAKHK